MESTGLDLAVSFSPPDAEMLSIWIPGQRICQHLEGDSMRPREDEMNINTEVPAMESTSLLFFTQQPSSLPESSSLKIFISLLNPTTQTIKMRSFAFLLPALAVASPLAQTTPDGWADGPDPNQIQITSASFSGNGCPQGTVSTSISTDRTVSFLKHTPLFSWI